MPSSWILLLNFGNYVANKHDLVPVLPGLVTVPLPFVLVSPMYVPGTTDQVGSLEALYDLLPESPVSTEIDKKEEHWGSCSGLRRDFLQGSIRDF